MGLYTGSISYTRYTIEGNCPDDIKKMALNKLNQFSFREIDPMSLKEKSTGWVSAENIASTFFEDLHFLKEPYMAFSMRIDTRRIPPLAMKAALLMGEIKYKKATGMERLKKTDKDMIRDEAWQRLIKRALPSPAVYDVCWNMTTGSVLFFSNNAKTNDEFVEFFHRTFDIKLLPLSPEGAVEHSGTNEAGSEKNENGNPLKMGSFGSDFLTYICFKSDDKAGLFAIQGGSFSLWLDGKIVMGDDEGPPPNTISYSGDGFTSHDLKQAIQSGKKVKEARIRLERGENTWVFTLRGNRFEVSGLKIDMPGTNDREEQFFGRMLSVEALNSLIDGLCEYFAGEVADKLWQTNGYMEFQKWLQKE